MLSKFRSRLTYANVMATIAVFLALGGGAYAAFKVPKNSVGTKQIKDGAVTAKKVRSGSLVVGDFRAGQLPAGPQGLKGEKGETGAQGDKGIQGDRGPSDAFHQGGVGTPFDLAVGDYVVNGEATDDNSANGSVSSFNCGISHTGTGASGSSQSGYGNAPASGKATVPLQATVHLPQGGSLVVFCTESGATGAISVDMTATRVGTLTP
jgi:hypothetical protein